ncbi:MAG: hypothetical protein KJ571_06840 [Bacteroidetes bacterium]|nr:hypothetical protein [Bacteroidota bacterium]
MKEYGYPFLARLIYRYANIPVSFLLIIYVFISIVGIREDWLYVISLIINLVLLYVLNRYYFKMYKMFPYKIQIDNEKIICSDFMNKSKRVEVKLIDISRITGGIFSGSPIRPIYISDEKNNITIGFNQHLKDYNKFLTIVLSNIPQELYNDLLEKIKENSIVNKYQKKKEKSK